MARRCCERWCDDECAECGSLAPGRARLRFVCGTNLGEGMPAFCLGVVLGSNLMLVMLGPFVVGFAWIES